MTQAQDFADLSQAYSAGNVALSNRNFIVDGAKEQWSIAQGTTQPIPVGPSGAVMYYAQAGTGTVGTYGRGIAGPGPVGRLGWPRAGNNYSEIIVTTPCTGSIAARTCPNQYTRIEDVNILESGSFTFSVTLANAGASSVNITQLNVGQNFGTGGSPSANVNTQFPVNWVLPADNTWRRYSARVDIPSIAGKTIGTNGNQTSWTQIEIDYPVGVVFDIKDCFWQLEPCSPLAPAAGWPTAFEYRGQAAEAQRVARYYQSLTYTFAQQGIGSAGMVMSATSGNAWMPFPAGPMRISPTISSINPLGAGLIVGSTTSVTLQTVNPSQVQFSLAGSGLTPGQTWYVAAGNTVPNTIVFDARL
jgi:hypothetical protein